MKSSIRDNLEGKIHLVKGKVKEVVGKAAGNQDLEAEGRVENLEGKIQTKISLVKKIVDK
jgi:uncharacterized protein YjbJ (UPF0337 family)